VVVVVLLFFSRYLQYLPHCILASIVFTIAIGLINVQSLRAIRRETPGEFTLAVITALAVVVLGVEHGILLAVVLSLLRHVRHSYRPHTMMLAPGAGGRWQPVPARPGTQTAPGLIVYRFGADLFYANDHFFVEDVRALIGQAPSKVRWFVVDASAITDLDYSAARSLNDLLDLLKQQNVEVVFARVNRYLRSDMDRHGITEAVKASCVFSTMHEALAAVGVTPQVSTPGVI
jgi:SulP family sulfate permease